MDLKNLNKHLKKYICWKCRYLTTEHGFLKRKKRTGPCDKCLGQTTVFQRAWAKEIWLKFIPKKKKKQPTQAQKESQGKSRDSRSLNSAS